MKKTAFIILLTVLICPAYISAQQKLRVGIVEFEEKNDIGLSNARVIVPELLVSKLKSVNKYELTERILLKKALEEQELQMSGLTDSATVSKVGNIYNIDAIVTGSIMKVGSTITISGRVINTETADIIASGTIKFSDINNVEEELESLAYQLSGYSVDEYNNIKASSSISKSRYGVRLGAGVANHDSEVGMVMSPVYFNLSIFYHSRYFDFEIMGSPPPSKATNLTVLVNINPFTHFGFGVVGMYVYDGITKEDLEADGKLGFDGEYQAALAGINIRATDRLRASFYMGLVLYSSLNSRNENNQYIDYEAENFYEVPAAAIYLSMEYYINDQFSIMLDLKNVGVEAEATEEAPINTGNTWMGTLFLGLSVGYSFQL